MTNVPTGPAEVRQEAVPESGIRTYVLLWISQWLACAAVSFTVFVVGVNIYENFADSLWLIALGYAILFVPFPILSPLAGAFVDRYGQRPALLISNIGTLVNLVVLVVLMSTDSVGAWYSLCAVGTSTILRTLQLCAIESVVPLLVPKRHYGRANGPRMLLTGTFVLAGPLLVYLLLSVATPVTIVMAECVLVVIAIAVVFSIRFPAQPTPEGGAAGPSAGRSVVAAVLEAWGYLRSKKGLLTMVGFLAIVSGVLGALEVGASGVVVGFSDQIGAIVVSTSCWLGMVVASILMVVWGIPRRIVRGGLLGSGLVFAVALMAAGFRPNLVLVSVGGFVAMGSLAIIIASFQTVLHLKVEQHFLGRAVGIKNSAVTLSHIVGDVGSLVVGIGIFATAERASGDGVWGWRVGQGWEGVDSPVLAAIIGDGPGRGWALFIMLIGIGVAVTVAILRFRGRALNRVENDLPDVTPQDRLVLSGGDPVPTGITESAPEYRST